MLVTLNTPVFNPKKKCHVITLQDTPSFDFIIRGNANPSRADLEENPAFMEFLQIFLEKASPFFSKPLELKTFLHRLTPIWDSASSFSKPDVKAYQYWKVLWTPAEVHMYPSRYEMHWMYGGAEEAHFSKSSPGLEDDEEILPTIDSLEDAELVEAESSLLPVINEVNIAAIPFKETGDDSSSSKRELLKQKVRQARLRVALAQLRAERLAEKYYVRYGNFEDVDGDSGSELSWDDAVAAPDRLEEVSNTKNIGSR
jgi:hypothetical protein